MNEARPDIFAGVYKNIYTSTANKYYSSAGHHEKKNKKNHWSNKIFGGNNKTMNKTSLMTFSM